MARFTGQKKTAPDGSEIPALEFLNTADEVLEFGIGNLDLPLDRVHFVQQLSYPHIHEIDNEL